MPVSTRRSLPEQVAARIHEQISDGTYPAGSQLPLQKEIAHHFGVSVSVVRESLALLAAGGLVWSRAGTGTFVSADAHAALRFPMWVREPSSPQELAECLEARDLLTIPPEPDTRHIRTTVTLQRRLSVVRDLLRSRKSLDFDETFGGEDRFTQAVTLFALLELYRRGEATWTQKETFGRIEVHVQ